MPTFDFSFTVDGSLEAVHEFHKDTSALKQLNPPGMIVQLHHVEPMAENSIAEFTLWFGPIPMKMKAVHRNVSINGFQDTLVEGPASHWQHTHSFTRLGPMKSRINEHIEYEYGTGLWNGLLSRALFNQMNLFILFTYRKWITQRAVKRIDAARAASPSQVGR